MMKPVTYYRRWCSGVAIETNETEQIDVTNRCNGRNRRIGRNRYNERNNVAHVLCEIDVANVVAEKGCNRCNRC